MENYYAALNYTDTLENDNDDIMVKIQLHMRKGVSHYQCQDRLKSNRRLHREGSLQQTWDQDDQSKKPKGDLPCGQKIKRDVTRYPYDESTYGD